MASLQSIEKYTTNINREIHRAEKKHPKRFGSPSLWVSLGALLLLLPVLVCSAVIIYFQVQQLNLPWVFVYDQPVGMMSIQETSDWIDLTWNNNRRINLISNADPEISYWVSPAELGLWIDPQGTANAAFAVGRSKAPLKDIRASIQGEPEVIFPVLYFDETIARETLVKFVKSIDITPLDAQIEYKDGQWLTHESAEGRKLDIDSTIQSLVEDAFNIMLTGTHHLEIKPQSPTVFDLSPVVDEIETVISQDLSLTAYDPILDERFKWSVPIEIKRSWVSVKPEDYAVGIAYDQDDVRDLIKTWEKDLGEGRSFEGLQLENIIKGWEEGQTPHLMLRHNPTSYTVSPGESLWSISLKLGMPMYHIMAANEGLTTNNIKSGMVLDIPSKNILLPLPVVENKRIVVDISEQRMTVYENGEIRNTYIVSTGVSNSPTMAGIFQVQTHELNAYASNWDLYMPHFMGIYEAWPGFMNGIHGLPLLSSGRRLWASTLGSPASYGCIILDLAAAEVLYTWAETGVVVEIRR
ncbi:MAG: L,D-transpeptidase family protein [Brevefilum sp.]|nr:L,D-transpeptidase family protein [Brevefilum sp.]